MKSRPSKPRPVGEARGGDGGDEGHCRAAAVGGSGWSRAGAVRKKVMAGAGGGNVLYREQRVDKDGVCCTVGCR